MLRLFTWQLLVLEKSYWSVLVVLIHRTCNDRCVQESQLGSPKVEALKQQVSELQWSQPSKNHPINEW